MFGPPILAFATATAYWPGLLSAAVVPRWAILAAGLPLVSWLDPRHLSTPGKVLLALAIGCAGISLFWTPNTAVGINELIHFLIFSAAVVFGACIKDITYTIQAMAWGVAVSCVIAVFQWYGISVVAEAASPSGLFYNRDFLAEIAAVFFVWAVLSKNIPLSILLSISLFICGSRVALVCMAVSLVTVLRPRIAVILVVVCTLIIAIVTIGPYGKIITAFTRVVVWYTALMGITPLGHGIGSFTTTYGMWEYAHSDFLQSFYELGIGAIPLFALFFIAVFRGEQPPLRAAMVCIFCEYLVAFPLHLPASAFLAGLLVGRMVRRWDNIRIREPIGRDYVSAYV